MPLDGTYTWRETPAALLVAIELKGVNGAKADLFCASLFVKVAYGPYLVALDLLKPVDADRCKAAVKKGVLHVKVRVRSAAARVRWRPRPHPQAPHAAYP